MVLEIIRIRSPQGNLTILFDEPKRFSRLSLSRLSAMQQASELQRPSHTNYFKYLALGYFGSETPHARIRCSATPPAVSPRGSSVAPLRRASAERGLSCRCRFTSFQCCRPSPNHTRPAKPRERLAALHMWQALSRSAAAFLQTQMQTLVSWQRSRLCLPPPAPPNIEPDRTAHQTRKSFKSEKKPEKRKKTGNAFEVLTSGAAEKSFVPQLFSAAPNVRVTRMANALCRE